MKEAMITLGQFIDTPDGGAPTLLLVLAMVGVVALAFTVWGVRAVLHRQAQQRGFLGLIEAADFEPVQGQEQLGEIADDLSELFGEQAMYARQVRVAGALQRQEDDGLRLVAAHLVLGLEASNANITTLDKLVLTVSGFTPRLPTFSLEPNHFLFATVQKDPVFHHTGRFGRRNLVLGEDKWFVAHVLGENVRELLAENRDLVIEAREDRLAFYLHDERVQPADLPAFVERCAAISRAIITNAPTYRPDTRSRRGTHESLLSV
ncbi:MAG: hypothetical protein GVY24_04555 [Planctomycetes bacterium]|jgi:hypothetical protein|nr:hypothetical protein [Planctomycetota bacterium]